VKQAKKIMTKAVESNSDPFLALLDFRNTPSENLHKLSPVRILYHRRTRCRLAIAESLLRTPDTDAAREALGVAKRRQAKYYNVGAKDRQTLAVAWPNSKSQIQ
jgi:hypothetical protein